MSETKQTEAVVTAASEKKQFYPGERSIVDIIKDLSKPIHPSKLKQKKAGNNMITFIPWFNAVKYLDLYAPGWTSEIRSIQHIKDLVVMTVRINIPAKEGVFFRESTGNENDVTNSFGDPFSNSESMGLRRAASKFGLGLQLYDK